VASLRILPVVAVREARALAMFASGLLQRRFVIQGLDKAGIVAVRLLCRTLKLGQDGLDPIDGREDHSDCVGCGGRTVPDVADQGFGPRGARWPRRVRQRKPHVPLIVWRMLAIIAASEGSRSSRTSCVPAASKIF
jgi:hypothetical protein